MVASVQSPEDLVNLVLRRIGHPNRIGSLYEGSTASKAALDTYAQTRDAVLRENDWGFAQRDTALALQKQAPPSYVPPNAWSRAANPPLNWLYQYAYPTDCVKVRAIKVMPLFTPDFDPQPIVFDIANDNTLVPPAKVILCNFGPAAMLTYTGQVTDLTTWEPLAVEAFIEALGRRLAISLGQQEAIKVEGAEEPAELVMAENIVG